MTKSDSNVVTLSPTKARKNANLEVALSLAKAGIPIFPCDPDDKTPRVRGDWQLAATTEEKLIKQWWRAQKDSLPAFSPGMVGLFVVDCDRHGGPDGVAEWRSLVDEQLDEFDSPVVHSPSNGQHVYFSQLEDQPLGNRTGELPGGVDVRGVGGYVIAPGAVLPDGRAYSAVNADVLMSAPPVPDWLFQLVANKSQAEPPEIGEVTERERAYARAVLQACAEELSEALPGARNRPFNAISFRLGRLGGAGWIDRDEVEAAVFEACQSNGLIEKDGDRKVRQIFNSGWNAGLTQPHPLLADTGIPYSEISLAIRFAERFKHELRFVDDRGRWISWDGKRWTDAKRYSAFNRAQQLCREAASEALAGKAVNLGGAKKIESGNVVGMVEKLARGDERLSITSDMLDQHDWLLNTPGGVVDLRTGEMSPHDPELLITKMAKVTPDANCPTPTWDAFQQRIADGDGDLVAFKLRWYGYGLTGVTHEQKFVFGWGEGSNGKGTEAHAVSGILDEYHRIVPVKTLVYQRFEGHPTDLAGLAGARLVMASETPEGMNWDEVKIKTLTGGDKITARFMRGDFFDFWPKFKLTVHGNNKPGLKSVDEAIRRRVLLVPYSVTIPAEERDPELGEKLKAEWPGILHKLVQGCLEWQQMGLAAPAVVVEATNAYLDDQDLMAQFLEEWCVVSEGEVVQSSELFAAWREFCEDTGRRAVGQQKDFNDQLEKRGFEKEPTRKGKLFHGLKLVAQAQQKSDEAWAAEKDA